MTKLQRLYDEQGQSPWLDNLTRPYLRAGTLAWYLAQGIRGVTANPTILAKAIERSDAYDEQFAALERLAHLGVDMNDVGLTLEDQGINGFHQSFAHLLETLEAKAGLLARP